MSHATHSPTVSTSSTLLNGVARLHTWGVIQVTGEDAAKFIHSQLTHDFALLDQNHARLAGFCSAKGRLLASFIGFKTQPDTILLLCSRDLLVPTLKRLSMFVLRAKVRLSDASDAFAVYGLIGDATKRIAASEDGTWASGQLDRQTLVQVPPANGQTRQLCIQAVDLAAPEGAVLAESLWQWTEVQSGVATVTAATADAFVPQMLNYESVGGVSFAKGCYPGQEVVARSQFRGTLKRRAFILQADHAVPVPAPVFAILPTEEEWREVGSIVQSAQSPDGTYAAIACLQTLATQATSLRLDGPEGVVLTICPLPYPLLDDI